MSFEYTYAGYLLSAQSGMVAAGLANYHMHLFQNDFMPDKTSLIGDFVEATFDGYADQLVNFSAIYLNGSNQAQSDAASITWVKGVGSTDNTIYGIYMTDASDAIVIGFEILVTPIVFDTPAVSHLFYQLSPTMDSVP